MDRVMDALESRQAHKGQITEQIDVNGSNERLCENLIIFLNQLLLGNC